MLDWQDGIGGWHGVYMGTVAVWVYEEPDGRWVWEYMNGADCPSGVADDEESAKRDAERAFEQWRARAYVSARWTA